jgi:antibiotic biosynthesis monooxygenase (ABM) superfamily enzyme
MTQTASPDRRTPLQERSEDPVTVVVSRTVAPGRERDYREWTRRMLASAEPFPNNLGAVILSPSTGRSRLHHLVLRFADRDSLRRWEDSDLRQQLSREADAFSKAARVEATGMEVWFDLPDPGGHAAPPKWKMAIVGFLVVYPVTLITTPLTRSFLADWPLAVQNALAVAVLVTLMTYLLMPFVTQRVLRRWLYRPTRTHADEAGRKRRAEAEQPRILTGLVGAPNGHK